MAEKKKITKILCCNECQEHLKKIGENWFCPECGIALSVQDIFIIRMCPECNVQARETTSGDYVCPKCNQTYEA